MSNAVVHRRCYQLYSLYTMLLFHAHRFFNICSTLSILKHGIESDPSRSVPFDSDTLKFMAEQLAQIRTTCEEAGLKVSIIHLDRVIAMLEDHADVIRHVGLAERIKEISVRIQDELQLCLFMHIPSDNEGFYNDPRGKFGKDTLDKFPSIVSDVEAAGKCYATGNSTASVFHLMRVMECGLRALGKSLKDERLDPKRNPSWETILSKCDDEMKKPIKDRAEQWRTDNNFYSEATANIRAVKDAWRNPTMHVEQSYDQDQALAVFNAVKAFMRHISGKLSDAT